MPSYAVYADDSNSNYDAGPNSSGAVLRRKWKDYLDRSGDGGRENRGRAGAYNQRSVSPQERAVVEGPGQGVNESGDINPGRGDELRAMKARSWANWRDPNPSKHKDPSGSNDTDDSDSSSGGSGASSPFARDLKDKGGNPAANKMAAYIDSKTSSAGNWDEQVNSASLADDVLGNFQKNQRVAAETGETSLNRELAINRAVWDVRDSQNTPENETRDPPPEEDGPWPPNGRGSGSGGWDGSWPDGGGGGGGLGAIGMVAVAGGGAIGLYALATYMGWL